MAAVLVGAAAFLNPLAFGIAEPDGLIHINSRIEMGLGVAIGVPLGVWVPMTAMPQRIALSHAFGGLAAALVGVAHFYLESDHLSAFETGVLGIEMVLGFLVFTGSLMAARPGSRAPTARPPSTRRRSS
jgi:NAD(P) transhydrogenase subunit beta